MHGIIQNYADQRCRELCGIKESEYKKPNNKTSNVTKRPNKNIQLQNCNKTYSYKTPNYKTPDYKTPNVTKRPRKRPITKRPMHKNAELQNVQCYITSNNKKPDLVLLNVQLKNAQLQNVQQQNVQC